MKTFLLFILIGVLSPAFVNANQLGQTFTLKSKYLNEEREIVVSVPSNYEDEPFYEFPVLYLTDANSQFDHAASMVHYLSGSISPMIVVGIFTPDRWGELKPYTRDKQPNPKAENLRRFIVEEVKAFIKKNYRTVNYSLFAGHSLGGSFAANAYLKGTNDFDVFFALAPNFAMGSEVMFDLLPQTFTGKKQPKVYFSFEGVTPFSTPIKSYHQLSTMLLDHQHLQETHKVELFQDEDHMSITHIALYQALNEIYKDWFLYIPSMLKNKHALQNHYQNLSKKLGYKIKPTEFYLRDLVSALISMEHIELAENAAKTAQNFYPDSHFSYSLLADVEHAKKNAVKEAKYLEKAVTLSSHDTERQSRYQSRLAKI